MGGKTDRRVEIFKRNIRLKNLVKVRDEEGRNAWPDETYSVKQVDNVFRLFIVQDISSGIVPHSRIDKACRVILEIASMFATIGATDPSMISNFRSTWLSRVSLVIIFFPAHTSLRSTLTGKSSSPSSLPSSS